MSLRINKSEFKTGEKKVVKNGDTEILVIYLGGSSFYAVNNKCPHLGCKLDKTGVVIREELVCQCHFTHFSLKTGEPRRGATRRPLPIYKVIDKGDEIEIET
ncbi:Rieske (2Fe-2S) protein [Sulfuracidifex tepidarius]|uniref:Sulredoxin n=1 Tax=Sulfuracidifex tepidarius TaxID=1294262 RepID=A0A510E3H4_9CREN|nr:Rieske (2Fe-2S) protein [Sulfuracidifex tepidarius]BBG24279.1 Sulredoxin [Sulfuracidifex tepidarius]BBG27036.1 Sulredoxin [Sulfuracidifex tepidarius]